MSWTGDRVYDMVVSTHCFCSRTASVAVSMLRGSLRASKIRKVSMPARADRRTNSLTTSSA